MAVWSATKITVTKSEFDIPNGGGNRAVNVGFTSDILKDGVLHHKYNEPNVGVHPNLTISEHVTKIIEGHLAAWSATTTLAAPLPVADIVHVPPAAPQPLTAKEIARAAFVDLVKTNRELVNVDKGGFGNVTTDIANSKKAIKDALDANPEFRSLLQGA